MSTISTHVLDTAFGKPAHGVPITLERQAGDTWETVGSGTTNEDGRIKALLGESKSLEQGTYRMTFATQTYFAASSRQGFYPKVQVEFVIAAKDEHYHVPLLLSPFGYSTYRGS